ncbi:DUF2306 domain-containing protein [Cellulomonas aerilata]|uniref:DUF2306 domain-containing protein n=1 Tax=Cellulomonas aerilata TaxID=515326 RepID=A0A512DA15_9CELL|nr:DUF2306 domain-containing protein [Cellulomonas aerilata]GEO33311.1 hypothetical protein CAE01nite_10360 [Cellulomonas aerilata]
MDALRGTVERPQRDGGLPGLVALRRAALALVLTVWVSIGLFGVYILAHYAGAIGDRDLPAWNAVLPRLYERDTPAATAAIGLHFFAGGVILLLGGVQLIGSLRSRYPVVHRSLGRVYVGASLLAGLGGLGFIVAKGTVGGTVMDVGFGLYGVLMVVCAVQAYRHARARRVAPHRAWALRLFALAVGSWLYRMDYGFWLLLFGEAGHTEDFRGAFDRVMCFFFYVPNLLVVEAFVRGRRPTGSAVSRRVATGVLLAATGFLLVGTYFFAVELWLPAIADRLGD